MLRKLVLFFLFCSAAAFLFFFLSAQIPLWSSDEGRFAELARGMALSGNWIVPYFNGLPYLEKPVLAVWTTALSFKLFGVHALTARIPGILSGLAGLAATYLFTRRLFDKHAAVCASLCLLTTVGYILVARFAVIDMQMVFFLSVALFSIMTALFEKETRYYLLAAAAMGLTLLLKGLLGAALPCLIFLAYSAFNRRLDEFKKVPWLAGILILLAVTIPWFWAMTKREPEFLNVFFFQHQFQRFSSTGSFGRSRPFFFFTYVFLVAAFPWCLFLPAAIKQAWKSAGEQKQKMLFLLCWIGVIFVFFSIPRAKLPYYIVPACVPTAVLVGVFLSGWIKKSRDTAPDSWENWSWKIASAIFLIGVPGVNIAMLFSDRVPEMAIIRPWIPFTTVFLALGGILSFYFNHKKMRQAAFLSLAAATYAVFLMIFYCMLQLSPFMSTKDFSDYLKQNASKTDIIAVFASPDSFSDFPFYLQRRIVIVGSDRGTLTNESMESDADDVTGWFYSADEFSKKIFPDRAKRVFCLLEKEKLPALQQSGLASFQILMESHERILISNS